MFSTKNNGAAKKKRTNTLAQFGMTEIPDDFDVSAGFAGDGDDDDEDLEAELAALAGSGGVRSPKPQPAPRKPKAVAAPIPLDPVLQLNEVVDDIDDNEEGDAADLESDADLMNELHLITASGNADTEGGLKPESGGGIPVVTDSVPQQEEESAEDTSCNIVTLLQSRIEMYRAAEANAKAAQQSSKVRRLNRGLKTLNDLLRRAQSGQTIPNDEIPPEVSVQAAPNSPPPATAPPSEEAAVVEEAAAEASPPRTPDNAENLSRMRDRQREYKLAALECKRSGDTAMAMEFIKVIKRFDAVIKMCEDGQEVDLSDMPPPPAEFKDFLASMQAAATPAPESPAQEAPVDSGDSLMDALKARLGKYQSVEEVAKNEGNASKARRFGRIVKQYQEAIAACKAGKTNYEYGELPIPPGFGPLPCLSSAETPKKTPEEEKATSPEGDSVAGSFKTTPPPAVNRTANKSLRSVNEQQKKVLLERQREYKVAALQAKKSGDIAQAKELLKICKGFDELITAANGGLPVDMSTLPVRPFEREELENSFSIVTTDDCDADGDLSEIRTRVEEQLVKQLMMCKNTRDHLKALGDVAGMNRFENLGLAVQRDLDVVRYARRKDISMPKFHYEKKNFSIVRCNTDLTDNELEIVVVRGINYNVSNPKDVDTYVKVEFPLLNETTFRARTNLIKDTDNPEYEQRFKVDIVRSNRQFQRLFKRHSVKFEVYSRGGFLRSDILIGVVTVKLQPLETKCDIHNTYDLMEGRKAVGGKLEIKLRLRNPILTKQMELLEERWLLLDS